MTLDLSPETLERVKAAAAENAKADAWVAADPVPMPFTAGLSEGKVADELRDVRGRWSKSDGGVETQLDRLRKLGLTVDEPSPDSRYSPQDMARVADTIESAFKQYPLLRTSSIRPLDRVMFTSERTPYMTKLRGRLGRAMVAAAGGPPYEPTRMLINDLRAPEEQLGGSESGWLSPASMSEPPSGVIWHELGHALAYASGQDTPGGHALGGLFDSLDIQPEDAASVSEYAASSTGEAIGEFSAMWNMPGFRDKLGPELKAKVGKLMDAISVERPDGAVPSFGWIDLSPEAVAAARKRAQANLAAGKWLPPDPDQPDPRVFDA